MIEGKRIKLRGWREVDVESLLLLRDNIDIQFNLIAQPRPHSPERLRRWLSDKSGKDNLIFFVIADKETDLPIGYIQYSNIQLLYRRAELGICISEQYQSKGFGSEAMLIAEQYLIRTFNIKKIVLNVLEKNDIAIRSYLKNGFVQCGLMRNDVFIDGSEENVVLMEKFITLENQELK